MVEKFEKRQSLFEEVKVVEKRIQLKLAGVVSGRYKQIRDEGGNADIL